MCLQHFSRRNGDVGDTKADAVELSFGLEVIRRMLAAYAAAMRLKRVDVRALVDNGERDPRCFEHRRRQLAAQAAAETNERARAEVVGDTGFWIALGELERLEAERRGRFPVPGDLQPTAENTASVPGKIANKVPGEDDGLTTKMPAPRYTPTAGRRRRAPPF